MPRSLHEISLDFNALQACDFDWNILESNGPERLYPLCDELAETVDRPAAAAMMFEFMERLHREELGSPGPLVHLLERWHGVSEPLLAESVRRQPTPLTTWMINRILNANPSNRDRWHELLQAAVNHPKASDETKDRARDFLEYQFKRWSGK